MSRIDGCPIPREYRGKKAEKNTITRTRNVVNKYFLLNFFASKKQRTNPEVMFIKVATTLAFSNARKEKGKKYKKTNGGPREKVRPGE